MPKTLSPIDGHPRIKLRHDSDGNPILTVKLTALKPFRKKWIDRLRWVGGAAAAGWTLNELFQSYGPPDWVWGLPLAAFPAGLFGSQVVSADILKTKRTIKFTQDHILIPGKKPLDRRIQHSFAIMPHKRASKEARSIQKAIEKARLKGKAVSRKPYYGEGGRIVALYGHLEVPIIEFYGPEIGQELLSVLLQADSFAESVLNPGQGMSFRVEDDWSESAGGL